MKLKTFLFIGFLFLVNSAFSQQLSITQNLSFGTFAPSVGTSTVTISPNGTRTISGGAIAIGFASYSPVILSYTASSKKKTSVHILYDTNINITSPNGYSMEVRIGPSDKNQDRYTTLPNQITEIRIGGRLTINNIATNPSGSYQGTFNITIIQE